MNQEEQGKKTNQVKSDATVKDLVIPAKPTRELSEQELAGVAGGSTAALQQLDPTNSKFLSRGAKGARG